MNLYLMTHGQVDSLILLAMKIMPIILYFGYRLCNKLGCLSIV